MILTVSDNAWLSASLSRWELGEYISEAFVIIACAGELVADLKVSWLTNERKERIQKRSTILLVAALSVSLLCLFKTNELSGDVIVSLGRKAEEALDKVGAAQHAADIIEKRLDVASNRLAMLVEALRQPNISAAEIKKLSQDLAKCPSRDAPVLLRYPFNDTLGMDIFNALHDAGFTNVLPQPERVPWMGVSLHGPLAYWPTQTCIEGSLSKRVTIFGLSQSIPDAPGSPITISVGENPPGKLPK